MSFASGGAETAFMPGTITSIANVGAAAPDAKDLRLNCRKHPKGRSGGDTFTVSLHL